VLLILIVGGMMALTLLQRRQAQRQRRALQDSLKRGDRVVTLGGIVGRVTEVKGDRVTLRVADGVELEFVRWGIGQRLDG
jgi:preprotein translocase subunit YajC